MKLMEEDATSYTDRELIAEVITKNIPSQWKMQFKLQALHKEDHLEEVITKLQIIEGEIKVQDEDRHHEAGLNPKNSKNSKGEEREEKNMCKLPGHKGHTWAQCFNNKNGDDFKGTALSLKDFDKDGKLKKKVEGDDKSKGDKKEHNLIEPFKVCLACSNESDSEEEYNEFNQEDDCEQKQEVMSSEMLVAIPII